MTDHSFNNKNMPRTKKQFEEIRKNTRHTIMESALLLFSEKGFKGTSISDIANAAGVSKGLAYNYFKSKNELMIAVLKLFEEEIGKMFYVIEEVKDPFKQIKIMINQTFKMLKEQEKFWRLYMNFAFQPEVQKVSGKVFDEFLIDVFQAMEIMFKRVGIKNPAAEAKLLGAILDGISIHYILDKENYPLEKMRKFLIKKYSKENLRV